MPKCQQLLRGSITGNTKVYDLDVAPSKGSAARELPFENRPEGAFTGHLQCFSHRGPQDCYSHGIRAFCSAVLAVAQTIAVDCNERLTFPTEPARRPGIKLTSGDIVIGPEHWFAKTNGPQNDLSK
jgi:hypothetical protein